MPKLETPPKTSASQALSSLTSISMLCWNTMLSTQHDGITTVWNNPHATPQAVCDSLGTQAADVFDEHGALTDFIVERCIVEGKDPKAHIKLPKFAFTRNQNGTVTVLDSPYVP